MTDGRSKIETYNAILIDRSYVLELIEKLARAYQDQTDDYVILTSNENYNAKIVMFNIPRL